MKFEDQDKLLEELLTPSRYYTWRKTTPSEIYLDGTFNVLELLKIRDILNGYTDSQDYVEDRYLRNSSCKGVLR